MAAVNHELEYAVVLSHNARKARVVNLYGELTWIYKDDLRSPLRHLGSFSLPHGISLKNRMPGK
ncbi:hypothetical protein RQN30_01075 [Arcanobacterium hippocoleae]